jgi:hypothetical protein
MTARRMLTELHWRGSTICSKEAATNPIEVTVTPIGFSVDKGHSSTPLTTRPGSVNSTVTCELAQHYLPVS